MELGHWSWGWSWQEIMVMWLLADLAVWLTILVLVNAIRSNHR